ncbi:restriction of telomere capping protein 5 [Saccharata proteae CBS 121410]|uniref:Restriction of telomere capping protein 5 n=1 Tax=Saccharata proteae CBS 121410 TaxID=1314787 RepID=A0A9P4HR30_9PEZI|nr:restriction of telomere capping protein 5 [Saccharata proteae CBS 121410]
MGQAHSSDGPPPSLDQLSHELARRFANKCYTPLELYCYTSVFKSLAESSSGVKYWSEATLCRFLELPDALAVGSVIFQMASYLGAFPFPSQAPAILTHENLLKVVTLLTRRHGPVLGRKGKSVWLGEVYRSLAVYDRGLEAETKERKGEDETKETGDGLYEHSTEHEAYKGFAIDAPSGTEDDEDDGDELVLAALDSMDATEVFKHGEKSTLHHSIIPRDNFLRLLQLLLLIAPMEAQDDLAVWGTQLTDERLVGLRTTANAILAAFGGVEDSPGVTFKMFTTVVSSSMPYLFDGLTPLWEHFLFAKDFDLSKRKGSTSSTAPEAPIPTPPVKEVPAPEPILPSEGEILNLNILSQLSFMIKGNELFRRLRPLYSGGTHGFSMGSFEKNTFNWRAPSILLVSGTLLEDTPSTPSERTFADTLPSKRLPNSTKSTSQTLIYGAYIPEPWKATPKTCFSTNQTLLFQLAPAHDLFHASALSTDYAYFNRPPSHPSGIGFGSPLPSSTSSHHLSHSHHSSTTQTSLPLGPVSLHLDSALEFGIFTHIAAGGGSFHPSANPSRRDQDWQDRFEIDALEVWGCGGDEEADAQRKAWAWEEREAEARRRINIGKGDIEADRELLKMAGILSERSGGSV